MKVFGNVGTSPKTLTKSASLVGFESRLAGGRKNATMLVVFSRLRRS